MKGLPHKTEQQARGYEIQEQSEGVLLVKLLGLMGGKGPAPVAHTEPVGLANACRDIKAAGYKILSMAVIFTGMHLFGGERTWDGTEVVMNVEPHK